MLEEQTMKNKLHLQDWSMKIVHFALKRTELGLSASMHLSRSLKDTNNLSIISDIEEGSQGPNK
jgi:hypothetical protein